MAAPGGPALPWGHSGNAAPQQGSDTGDAFESSLRKIMLSAALGGLPGGPPAKRARTDHSNTASTLAHACDAVEACRALADAEDARPTDLAAGQRIEVKWQLEGDEGSSCMWWGAELVEQRVQSAGQYGNMPACESAPAVWTMRYDAKEGFESETREAVLVTKHVLLHGDMEEPLAWRTEGDAYEPSSDEEDGGSDGEDVDADEAAGRSYPLTAVSKAIEAQMGCSVETAALQRLQGSLPIEQQQTLAAGFSDFMSAITSKLRQAADAKRGGPDGRVVIESDDVKAALDSWEQEREAA